MRLVSSALAGIVFLSFVSPVAFAQSNGADLSITNVRYVSDVRYNRNQWFVTYQAELTNKGAARGSVTATVTSTIPSVEIVPGQGAVHFSPVPANSTVVSVDTFTLLVDRTVPFDVSVLSWSFVSPIANAGPNQSAPVGAMVMLSASNSQNPSGVGSLSYRWRLDSRPAGSSASINNANGVTCALPVDAPGSYGVSVVVDNGVALDIAAVTVSTVNTPPVANAGNNQTVGLNSTVSLNGSGSSDVDGDPLTYRWTLISYPPGSAALLANSRSVTPTFVVDKPGSYIVQLIVNDGKVDSTPSTVTITTVNTPPVANAGAAQTVNLGALVQLNGSGSTDVDGDVLTYRWTLITVPPNSTAALSNPAAINPTFTADLSGTYVAQLIVNDGKLDSAPATVSIATNAVRAPTANVGPNQTVGHGAIVTLSGSCTDPQALPCTLRWSLTTKPDGSAATLSANNTASPNFVADLPGIYIAQLIVNNGVLNSQPQTVQITTTNTRPVANPGQNRNVFTAALVALDGSNSSDADHDPLSYSWSFLAKPGGSTTVLQAANTATPSFFADAAGTYVAQLIVSDGYSNSDPATVTITASSMGIILTPSPLNLFNSPGTLTVTLSAPAGANGLGLSFSGYDNNVISLPSSPTVPANSTGANVAVTPLAPGSTNLTVSAPGYTPANVTVTVTTPNITLASNFTAVGIGRSVAATITLSAPAPVGGAVVTLSGGTGFVSFDSPSVSIPAGQTTASFKINGLAEGSAAISAASPGYNSATLNILVVKLGSITLPVNLTVGPNQSAALDVRLDRPAPADGVAITLSSGNTAVLTVSSSVFIAQGQTAAAVPAQVTGVTFGSAVVTASAVGFTGDGQSVKVGASLSFSTQAVSVSAGGVKSLSLLLSAPVPAGGLTISLQSSDPQVASVPASVRIEANQTSAPVDVTAGTAGSATITASTTATNVAGASLSVSVQASGGISVPANLQLSPGQSAAFPITLSSPAPQGGVVATLTTDPAKVSVSPATVTIRAGATAPDAQPQVTGVNFGTATVSVGAPGYTTTSGAVSVGASLAFTPSPLNLNGAETRNLTLMLSTAAPSDVTINLSASPGGIVNLPSTATIAHNATTATVSVSGAGAGSATITAASGIPTVPNGSVTVNVQSAGALTLTPNFSFPLGGSAPLQVTLSGPAPAGGVTVSLASNNTSKVTVSPATVIVPAGQTQPTTAPQVTGKDLGSADITATAPLFTPATTTVSVTATITLAPDSLTLAPGETKSFNATISGPAPANGLALNLSSSDPSVMTPGAPTVTIPAGATQISFPVKGVGAGTANVIVTVPPLAPVHASVTVSAQIDILMPATMTVAPGDIVPLPVTLARPQATPILLVLTTTDATKATVSPTTVTVPAGQTAPSALIQLSGLAQGSAKITATANGVNLSPASTSVTVGYVVTLSPANLTISGNGTTATLNIQLSGPAPAGGVNFSLTSSNPGVVTVPPNVFLSATSTSIGVRLTSVSAGSAVIHVNTPGMAEATANVTVVPPGSVSITGPASISLNQAANVNITLSTPAPIGGVTVELTSSDVAKVSLSQSSVNIPAGASSPAVAPQVVGANVGSATISVSASGYTASSPLTVSVGATIAWVSQNTTITGIGTQALLSLRLSTTAPVDGLTVNLSSSNPGVATVQATGIFIWDGSNAPAILIPVISVAAGTTTIHASGTNVPDVATTVTVVGPLAINTVSLPNGAVGAAYNASVTAGGGATPYTWSATGLPAGLSINATTGAITGTPTATGASTATVTVKDSSAPTQQSASKQFTITISGLSIATSTLPDGVAGSPYSATVSATGGATPYSWSATGLPAGLNIDSASGAISGTPTTVGVSSATLTVTDSTTPTHLTASKQFTITISGGVAITTASLPAGAVGVAYSAALAASGGTTPYSWSATGLPGGINIDPSSGALSGTPIAAGAPTVTVTVTDSATPSHHTASKQFTLTVGSGLSITTTSLPAASPGVGYSTTVAASGGTTPYTWSATGLPSGLTMNASTGAITGATNAAGSNNVSVTVTDSTTPTHLSATKQFTLTVGFGITLNPTDVSIRGNGNQAVVTLTLSAPAPDGGLEFTLSSSNTGVAMVPSFVPLSATSTSVGFRVTSVGPGTAVIHVSAPGIPEATANVTVLPPGTVSVTGPATVVLSQTGTLNVSLSTPAPTGGVTVQLTSSDASKVGPATQTVTILAGATTPAVQPQISGVNVGAATISAVAGGYTSSAPLTVNVTATVTWITQNASISGIGNQVLLSLRLNSTAPTDGVVVNLTSSNPAVATIQATGIFIWDGSNAPGIVIPVTAVSAGTTTIHASGTNIPDVTTTVTVAGPVSISTTSLPGGVNGAPYTATLAAAGGTTPYSWSATGLPAGLAIDAATGIISGTPASAGSNTVTVTVTDSSSPTHQSASRQFTLTVGAGVGITTASLPPAATGVAYSATVAAAGGTPPYSWSAAGLPAGWSINSATGAISGTPASAGSNTFTVTVTDSTTPTHLSASKQFTVVVQEALKISTASLPDGVDGAAYNSGALTATGGLAPYSWTAAGLPQGLTINASTGAISGTPVGSGTSPVNITVTDSQQPTPQTVTKQLNLTIRAGLAITTVSLPGGVATSLYSATAAVSGGVAPYTWSAAGLPAGLGIAPSTGVISGTPSAAGTSTVTLTVSDSTAPTPQSVSKQLSLTIGPALSAGGTLPGGVIGVAYSASLTATGGTPVYVWSATGLPPGLAINAASGLISGAPTTAGAYPGSVTVTDSTTPTHQSVTTSFNIVISPAFAITTASLPAGVATSVYSATVAAAGGTTPYSWSAAGLPNGLTINSSTGVISGTPGAAGSSTVTVTVTDSSTPTAKTAVKEFTLVIGPALSITTASIPNGLATTSYSATVAATGGTAPYTWTATGLPAGLTINASTGVISGTPTTAGGATPTVTATDSTLPTHQSTSKQFTITIGPAVSITTASLPPGVTGLGYSATVAASGGTMPYSWSASGLPAGLSIDASTGVISGTPSVSGAITATITVTDSTSPTHQSASVQFTITITPGLSISTTALPPRPAGSAYTATLVATGGTPPYAWSAMGLPNGFTLDSATGIITGSPTTAGSTTINVTVTDNTSPAHMTATRQFTLTITPQLSITTSALPDGLATTPYSFAVVAAGGTPPYAWSATGLPAGLTIDASSGVISGTPSAATSGSVNITVTDATAPNHQSATVQLGLTIKPQLSIVTPSLPSIPAGSQYSMTVVAAGGTTPYTWSATGLPSGFAINSSTGEITGSSASPLSASVTVTVTDATSPTHQTASKTYTLAVTVALSITTASLPSGQVSTPYSSIVAAAGGTTPYTWSAIGLPTGFAINSSTGELSGTASAPLSVTVTVTVTDATTPTHQSVSKNFTLTIANSLAITTAALPNGVPNTLYGPVTMAAAGGSKPYTWSSTDLPRNLSIDPSTGTISGTPVNSGTLTVHITVTDSSSPAQTTTKSFSLSIVSPPLHLDTTSFPIGQVNVAYSFQPSASGGQPPYNWTATGLPPGFTISNITGLITGTSIVSDSFSVTLTVTDASSPMQTASAVLPLVISTTGVGGAIAVTNANLGQNLQTQITITLSPAPTAAVTLSISSGSASVLLGSSDSSGATTVSTTIPTGTTSVSTYVKGFASSGTVPITAKVLGYTDGVGTVTLYPAGFVISTPAGIGADYTTFEGVTSALTINTARLDANSAFAEIQPLRGGFSIQVPLSNAPTTYGMVSPATLSFSGAGSSAPATFTAGTSSTGVTTITVGAPVPFVSPASGGSVRATVQASGILPCDVPLAVGKNLQKNTCAKLTGPALSPVVVTLNSNDPSRLRFSTSPTDTPTGSLSLTVPANQTSTPTFYIHAYDSAGTVTYTASATGYDSTTNTVTMTPSGFVIQTPFGLGANYTLPLGQTNPTLGIFTARYDSGAVAEVQAVAGGISIPVTVASSDTAVGTVLTQSFTIVAGTSSGTSDFHAVGPGTTNISANSPGYNQGVVSVNVQAPGITVAGGLTIGQFLQEQGTLILGVAAPAGGLQVTLHSNSPQLMLSIDPTKAGTASIVINVPGGQQLANYYIQSLGTSGAVTYTASAPGFTAGSASINLAPSGIVIQGPNRCSVCFVSASGGDQPLTVYTAYLDSSNTPINPQNLAGGANLSVALTVTNRAAGSAPGAAVIAPNTNNTVVQFTPGTAGTQTDVQVTTPTGWQTPNLLTKVTMSIQP